MSDDKELLVNLRNKQRAEVPLSDNALAARAADPPDTLMMASHAPREMALHRLRQAATGGDQVAADVLTLLGL